MFEVVRVLTFPDSVCDYAKHVIHDLAVALNLCLIEAYFLWPDVCDISSHHIKKKTVFKIIFY